ncbi:hypothetical protein HCH_00570 [Hahella chejuensis KCTC 2396]|uniref:Uncharacterized protein n=1 Tax=Hahella chejuensis (strain KCTC 2396) TaxID=349521 RepID=Q2SPF1_HAHCH|nr:hypothetical protein HCH_00570 [Hahella chejuensis KCTC 2396]
MKSERTVRSLLYIFLVSFLSLGGCDSDNNSSSSDSSGSVSATVEFPSGVTVASPVDASSGLGALSVGDKWRQKELPSAGVSSLAVASSSAYTETSAAISRVLSGDLALAASFDSTAFFRRGGDASCYGPTLKWQNHPDAGMGDLGSGELPSGDLGIWNASTSDGEACAAAQLNARMRDVQARVGMGMLTLAGMVAVYESTGATWPDDISPGTSVDLTAELNALSLSSMTFNSAVISLDAGGSVWSYSLSVSYDDGSGGRNISLNLQHAITDRDAGLFEGLFSYLVEDVFAGGNCGMGDNNVSHNGSVHYKKTGSTNVTLQSRSATACGWASTTPAADIRDNLVSSTVLSEAFAVDPGGAWADNFNVFTAEFNTDSLLGLYSYSWQAGSGDSHARILDIGIETTAGGEAYFGFGDRVQDSLSGQINGFICNWAGPGNDHSPTEFSQYAQRQFLTYDSASDKYIVSSDGSSDITYAPTNICMYAGGAFLYDRDLDGDLSDENASTVNVVDGGSPLDFDLMTVSDSEANIWEHIIARGYSLPAYP